MSPAGPTDGGVAAATPGVSTRLASAADLPAAAALFDAYRQFYDQPADPARALAFLSERLARHEAVLLLAEDGQGRAVGLCQLYPSFCSVLAGPILVLYDLYVAPEARGAGVGRALMQAAQAEARQRGAWRMDLSTARDNLRAQVLYESEGWVRDEVFFVYNKALPTA
jgi:ribosomal protein S18 acetylase RimI-like enzyme